MSIPLIVVGSLIIGLAYVVAGGYTYSVFLRPHAKRCRRCQGESGLHSAVFPDPDVNPLPYFAGTLWPVAFVVAGLWFGVVRPVGRVAIAAAQAGVRIGK